MPCDDATITSLIDLMDINKDGLIGWDEFEVRCLLGFEWA